MKICIAQTEPIKGNISANIEATVYLSIPPVVKL